MAADDAATIDAVLRGDVEQYAQLVDRYQGLALRVAYSVLGNDEDAKDASQDAFVSAFQSLAQFRGRAAFSTWLCRIVLNKCKDLRKRRSRQPLVVARVGVGDADASDESLFVDVDDPAAGPGEQAANRELGQRLSRAIAELPEQQRMAFLLHHVHGCSLDDVAAVMDCRLGTVKSHVFRATERLRTVLAPWLAEEAR